MNMRRLAMLMAYFFGMVCLLCGFCAGLLSLSRTAHELSHVWQLLCGGVVLFLSGTVLVLGHPRSMQLKLPF